MNWLPRLILDAVGLYLIYLATTSGLLLVERDSPGALGCGAFVLVLWCALRLGLHPNPPPTEIDILVDEEGGVD